MENGNGHRFGHALVALGLTLAAAAGLGAAPAQAARPGTILANGGTGDCSLVILDGDGRRVRCIATPGVVRSASGASLSPDATRIAFYANESSASFDDGLYVANADGSGLRNLVPSAAALRASAPPVWSPDGTKLAAGGGTGTPRYPSDIVVDVASGAVVQTGLASLEPLVFSPDGGRVFSADLSFKRTEIASVPVGGGEISGYGRLLYERTDPNGAQGLDLAFDPKGGRALLLSYPFGSPKVELSFQGPGGAPAQIPTASPERANDADFAFSPDGSRIAVMWSIGPVGGNGTVTGRLDLLSGDGQFIRTVSAAWLGGSKPSWAPDSSAFVVDGATILSPPGERGTRIVTRDGQDVTPTGLETVYRPAWTGGAPGEPAPGPVVGTGGPGTPTPGATAPSGQGLGIPVATAGPGCTASLQAGPAEVLGSCFVKIGERRYRTVGRVRVNGIDVVPDGQGSVEVDTQADVVKTSGRATVRLGPVPIFRGGVSWSVRRAVAFEVESTGGPDKPGEPLETDTTDTKLAGLPVKGSAEFTFEDGKTTGTVSVELPKRFVEGLTADVKVVADNASGLHVDELKASVDTLESGPAEIRDAELTYAASSGHWDGKATFFPRKVSALSINGNFGFGADGYFALGGGVDGLNKPLVAGVFFQAARAGLTVDPFSLTGGLGLTYGPQFKFGGEGPVSAARLDADFTYTDGAPATFELKGKGKVVNADFDGGVKVTTDGAVDADGHVAWTEPVLEKYGVDATLVGWYESRAFNIAGRAALSLPGPDAKGQAVASTEGIAGCRNGFGPDFGFGYRWRTKDLDVMARSCGIGSWTAIRPRAATFRSGARIAQVSTGAFTVPRGRRTATFSAVGTTTAPKVTLTGPGGVRVDTPADQEAAVSTAKVYLLQDPEQKTTFVAVDAPAAGRWRLTAAPGSDPVTAYRSAESRAPVRVRASVRRSGSRRVLSYRIRDLGRGGRVRFLEEGKGVRRQLGVTSRASGRIRFRPAIGAGGRRRVRAVVIQDGLARTSRVAARFTTGAVRPASPRRVRVARGRTTATVTWRGAPSAYRVSLRTSDGRRLIVQRSARQRRRVLLRAVPRGSTVTVGVQGKSLGGRLSRTARAVSRGR